MTTAEAFVAQDEKARSTIEERPVEVDEGFVLRINGKPYDATDLTLNEVEQIEDLCGGVSLDNLDLGRAKTLKAIVFVLMRRDEPEITLEEAGQIKLNGLLGGNAE